ncbi:hypothetical protein IAU59_000333 [Kwoniella sp. CBS 9459]
MRKGAGISALSRHTAVSTSYSTLSSTISSNQLATLQTSLESFRSSLLEFAVAHRNDIRADPAFRHQFQKMCAALGVDPLAGSGKGGKSSGGGGGGGGVGGWWSELVGMGEWEYELAVQVVDVCVSTRKINGGMIEMGDLIRRVERLRRGGTDAITTNSTSANAGTSTSTSTNGGQPSIVTTNMKGKSNNHNNTMSSGQITPEDILRSLEILKPLHAGYTIHRPSSNAASSLTQYQTQSSASSWGTKGKTFTQGQGGGGGQTYIRTIPRSLDTDQSVLLSIAATTSGRLIPREVRIMTGWSVDRVGVALEDCVMREGLGWVDEQVVGNVADNRVGTGSVFGRSEIWVIAATSFEE